MALKRDTQVHKPKKGMAERECKGGRATWRGGEGRGAIRGYKRVRNEATSQARVGARQHEHVGEAENQTRGVEKAQAGAHPGV